MAYTALTCDDMELPVEALLRRAMVRLEDGSWMLQTVDITGSGVVSFTLTSGSVTDNYSEAYEYDGRPAYLRDGETGDGDSPTWSVLWADSGSGQGWYITNGSAEVLYYSLDDVAGPWLCTTWVAGSGSNPLPVIVLN